MSGRDVAIPKNGIFMTYLKDQFELMKKKLKELLQQQNHICMTCDVWSSRAQAYLGISVHFINQTYQTESFVLAFREIKYRQTHADLSSEINKVFKEFDIKVSKITNLVTDGGSAFCKAFKVFGKGSDPLIEGIDDVCDDEEVNPFIHYDDGEHFYSNIISFDDELPTLNDESLSESLMNDDFDQSSEEEDNGFLDDIGVVANLDDVPQLPPHRRCLSHLLNLIPSDFEKDLPQKAKAALISTLSKLQTIWVAPRRSSNVKSICKDVLGCQLKIPVETRWNSKYDAVRQISDIGLEKMDVFINTLKSKIKNAANLRNLTTDDFKVISTYLKIMKPVATSLDRL